MDVEAELAEFKESLSKYLHLARVKLDVGTVELVERIQLELIREVEPAIDPEATLRENLEALMMRGVLKSLSEKVGGRIGDEVRDFEAAYASALNGDLEREGSKSVLIVVQAVSRAYANLRLESKGMVTELTDICPVCGAKSETMYKRGSEYRMACHFCGYEWVASVGRVICPICGNSDEFSLGYYSDKDRRVALFHCQECDGSWRSILDESIRAPRILMPLIALGAEAFRPLLERRDSQAPQA